MLFPLVSCPTHDLVTIKDVTLNNIQIHDAILPPGIIRCNETNPCTNMIFQNVNASGSWWRWLHLGYIVENVYGTVVYSDPIPEFINDDGVIYETPDKMISRAEFVRRFTTDIVLQTIKSPGMWVPSYKQAISNVKSLYDLMAN